MPTKPTPSTPESSAPDASAPDATRYRVLSNGITAPIGRPVIAYSKGDIVTADELGGTERVTKLLARKAIEEVMDGAD
jgi:hypothetical protein